MEVSIESLITHRLGRARNNLVLVEELIDGKYYDFAINRAYYAAFDAMRAVNALDGFDSSKHSGVIAHFNQFYVKTGKFERGTSSIIKRATYLREKSDYEDFYSATYEEAVELYSMVRKFVRDVEVFLQI